MNIYDKIGREKIRDFLLFNGYDKKELAVMECRKKIPATAAILITNHFKNYFIEPKDFDLSTPDDPEAA